MIKLMRISIIPELENPSVVVCYTYTAHFDISTKPNKKRVH